MIATQTPLIANDAADAHSLYRLDMRRVILDYEIRSSWWASWIGSNRLQTLAASYFAWKVRRKCGRWEQSRREAQGAYRERPAMSDDEFLVSMGRKQNRFCCHGTDLWTNSCGVCFPMGDDAARTAYINAPLTKEELEKYDSIIRQRFIRLQRWKAPIG